MTFFKTSRQCFHVLIHARVSDNNSSPRQEVGGGPEFESYTQQIFTNNLYFCKNVILLHVTKCKMLLFNGIWSNEIHSGYTEHIFLKE